MEARNRLENYIFGVKDAVKDYGDKLSSEDRKVNAEGERALKWLESNQLADNEEYEHMLEETQKVCSPLMAKLHGHTHIHILVLCFFTLLHFNYKS